MESKRKRGFTLLEILVVVIILAILTYIATPMYNKVVQQSDVADAINNISMLSEAQGKYFIGHGSYARRISNLETPLKSDGDEIITDNFTYQIGDPRENDYCIYVQNNFKDYALAKNYRKNSQILCSGSECDKISSFVEEGDFDNICSGGNGGGCNTECTPPQVLNPEQCECEEPTCDKTDRSCEQENENWVLLEGCVCGCPPEHTRCKLGYIWNEDKCKCEKVKDCKVKCAHEDDVLDAEKCICQCGKTSITNCKQGTLLEDCSCDNSCEERDCPKGKIWSNLLCGCVCESTKKCTDGQEWDSSLCRCVEK